MKTKQNVRQDFRPPDGESNPGIPKSEAGSLNSVATFGENNSTFYIIQKKIISDVK
jgi:hypothetical protein